jgi:glycine cleavage system H protein
MKLPSDLKYSPQHLWIRPVGDLFQAGITDYAQDLLGDIVFVDFPAPGVTLKSNTPCGLVESVKTGSDLHAPLSGTVEAINEELKNRPELLNEDPYRAWIFSFRASDLSELDHLLDAEGYRKLLQESE